MAFTGFQVFVGLALMVVAVMGIILGLKGYYKSNANKLAGKKSGASSKVKKHAEADAFSLRSTNILVGLVCSVGFSVLLFGWTQYEDKIDEDLLVMEKIDEIEQEVQRVAQPPPPPPPPPPPVIEEVPDEEIEEDIEFDSQDFDEEEIVDVAPIEEEEVEVAAPVVEEEEEEEEVIEEIFTVVEDMPSFPGCEDLPTNDERKKCTETNLLKFMYKNIKYPSIARENGIEGLVVVTFVVDKDGSIKQAKWLKDIGGGCADEATRVVKMMNEMPSKWTPGRQRSQPVQVRYNLPVRFRLQQN